MIQGNPRSSRSGGLEGINLDWEGGWKLQMQHSQVNDEPGATPSLFMHRTLGDLKMNE